MSDDEIPVRFGLHGQQAEVYRHPARFKVVVSGRRWGKTQLALFWLMANALQGKEGRYWYVALTRDDAKDTAWVTLKAMADPSWLAEPPREQELAVRLRNGAEVRLWSAEKGDTLRGRKLRALVMDEYADMDARVFHEILRPSLTDYGAPCLFIGTPKSYNHFYDLFLRGQSTDPKDRDWKSWQFSTVGNTELRSLLVEIEAARRDMDERTFQQEYNASFEAVSGKVYWAFNRGTHVMDTPLLMNLPVHLSFDFNYNPATAIIGQRFHDECRVVHDVFLPFRGGEATIASATACKEWLAAQGFSGPICIHGDSTGVNTKTTGPSDHQVLRDMFPQASWRIPTKQPNPRDRHAAVNTRCVTADGKTHMRIDPSCTRTIGDLERVIYAANGDVDQKSDPMLSHISDALGYWIHAEWPPVKWGGTAMASVPHLHL
jgi:hypothetical protein